MKQFATVFLRVALLGIGAGVLALCVLLAFLISDIDEEYLAYAYALYAVFAAIYLTALPYFYGLFKAWRLLSLIDSGNAFTKAASGTVKTMSVCAGLISLLYALSLPFFYTWADKDDAPGLMVIGLVLMSVPMIVAVFAALMQRLLSEAADMKSESELTV